jgi:hypothetical protein
MTVSSVFKETVELSLQTFNVIQSRGKYNKLSPYHNDIIELVNSNSKLFKQAIKQKAS